MATTIFAEIPLFSNVRWSYSVSLQGVSYQLTFSWNSRCSQWFMDIYTEEQVAIIEGVGIVPQYPMLEDYALEDVGMYGHFVLLPINDDLTNQLSMEPSVLAEFFKLYYVYNVED